MYSGWLWSHHSCIFLTCFLKPVKTDDYCWKCPNMICATINMGNVCFSEDKLYAFWNLQSLFVGQWETPFRVTQSPWAAYWYDLSMVFLFHIQYYCNSLCNQLAWKMYCLQNNFLYLFNIKINIWHLYLQATFTFTSLFIIVFFYTIQIFQ